jgi:hypothetical protein
MSHKKHWHGVRQPTNIPAMVTSVDVPDAPARPATVRDRSHSGIHLTVGEFVVSGTILEIQFDTCLIRGRVQQCRELEPDEYTIHIEILEGISIAVAPESTPFNAGLPHAQGSQGTSRAGGLVPGQPVAS